MALPRPEASPVRGRQAREGRAALPAGPVAPPAARRGVATRRRSLLESQGRPTTAVQRSLRRAAAAGAEVGAHRKGPVARQTPAPTQRGSARAWVSSPAAAAPEEEGQESRGRRRRNGRGDRADGGPPEVRLAGARHAGLGWVRSVGRSVAPPRCQCFGRRRRARRRRRWPKGTSGPGARGGGGRAGYPRGRTASVAEESAARRVSWLAPVRPPPSARVPPPHPRRADRAAHTALVPRRTTPQAPGIRRAGPTAAGSRHLLSSSSASDFSAVEHLRSARKPS